MLTDTSADLAEETVERFRDSVDSYNKKADRGYNISFCAGIVTIKSDQNRSIEALMSGADFLMYEKKTIVRQMKTVPQSSTLTHRVNAQGLAQKDIVAG